MILTAVIEMPQNTVWKMEHDKGNNYIKIDRPLNQPVPYSYGYIEGNNLCEDGDPIDCFVLTDLPIYPLVRVQIEIVKVIKCVDNGKRDDKLVGVVVGDFEGFKTVEVGDIVRYLETYKKGFEVLEVGTKEEAEVVYEESLRLYAEQALVTAKTLTDIIVRSHKPFG